MAENHDTYVPRQSTMTKEEWDKDTYSGEKYGPRPGEEPMVDVGDGHKLWAQQFGNPNGEPVIVLHGGPGGGCEDIDMRFFDPERYKIILFDQRGCGYSKPTLKADRKAAFKGNDTIHLAEDIEKVREHFGIKGKAHIMGGSWGTTLGLYYAIKHPDHVKSLNMRGVYVGNKAGIDFLWQGNATAYTEAPEAILKDPEAFMAHYNAQPHEVEGTYRAYVGEPPSDEQALKDGRIPGKYWPQHTHMAEGYARAWDELVRVIVPKEDRRNLMDAYVNRLEAEADPALKGTGKYDKNTHKIDPDFQQRVAFAFSKWEAMTSNFYQQPDANGKINLGKFEDPDFAVIFARTEARYQRDGLYLTEDGRAIPGGSNYLIDPKNLKKLADQKIKINIAHGANDEVCHPRDAHDLEKAYKGLGGEVHLDMRPETGHSRKERGNALAVRDIMDHHAPEMTAEEKKGTGTAVPYNGPPSSAMSEEDWAKRNLPKQDYGPDKNLHSDLNPKGRGRYVDVGDGHKLYVQEYGNPDGEPLIFLHGGPGGGGDDTRARYYNLDRFRLIVFDQRGAGFSKPQMHEDYDAAMHKNNTAALVEDIEKIRNDLGIKGKAHITGGSWGSTLALAYAIKHPEHVKSLMLSGIYLGGLAGAQNLFQGNATAYKPAKEPLTPASTPDEIKQFMDHYNAQPHEQPGSYRAYVGDGTHEDQIPKQFHEQNRHMAVAIARSWDEYVRMIPEPERNDMFAAYTKRLKAKAEPSLQDSGTFDPDHNIIDPALQLKLAFAYSKWEGILGQFSFPTNEKGQIDLGRFEDPKFAVTFARTEATYTNDGFYLTDDGSPGKRDNNYLMDNLHKIAEHKIPMLIVHGKRDLVCRPRDAIQLRDKYEALSSTKVDFNMPEGASHLQKEKATADIYLKLKDSPDRIPKFTRADWEAQPKGHVAGSDHGDHEHDR